MRILLRSRSLRFTSDILRQSPDSSRARLRWSGHDIFYRAGSADPFVLYQVLLRTGRKAEYYVPTSLKPKIIVDIGSNIGASILYFHRQFPDAHIYGFEPHPDTFRILQRNVGHLDGVAIFNYGLGAANERITARADTVNFGAFNTRGEFKDRGHPATMVDCQVRRLDDVLRELRLTHFDLLKIDCEGAEADIFATLPDDILKQCQWIVGEFHDDTGFDVLARLAAHFDLDLKKTLSRPRFRFHARNRAELQALSRSELAALQQ